MRLSACPTGVRTIAVVEAGKAILVLLAGFGLLALVHRDVEEIAAELIRRLHLNAANHYPKIFIDAAARVTDARLWLLAVSAMVYAIVRLVEAYGLWFERRWAEWIALLSGAVYLPVEVYELGRHVTAIKIAALVINLIIVAFIGGRLCSRASRVGLKSTPSVSVDEMSGP
jgi:uncharacterized membrane protein (DUF2068 family)